MDKQQFEEDNYNQPDPQKDYYDASQFGPADGKGDSDYYNPYGGFNPYGDYSGYGQYGKYDQYRNIQPEKKKSHFFKKTGKVFAETGIAAIAFLAIFGVLVMGIGIKENYSNDYDDYDYDSDYQYNEEAEEVEYREGLYSFNFDGAEITFPCEYGYLEDNWDFTLYESPSDYIINADESKCISFRSKDTDLGYLTVYNKTDEALPLRECMVEGVELRVRDYHGDKIAEFEYLDELDEDSDIDDFTDVLGTTQSTSSYSTTWDTEEGWIIARENDEGELESVEIMVYYSLEHDK